MDAKKEIKKQIVMVSILVVAVAILGFSSAYAFYTQTTSNSTTVTSTAATFEMETTLDNSSAKISSTALTLINESSRTTKGLVSEFTVTNKSTSTVRGVYQIILKDITITKNLYSQYFKWELYVDTAVVASGSFDSLTRSDTAITGEDDRVSTTASDYTLNTTGFNLSVGSASSVKLIIWLQNDENVNQVGLTEGAFSATIAVEGTPVR